MRAILPVLACLLASLLAAQARRHVVSTARGRVQGQQEEGGWSYLGIPYALVNESNPFGNSLPYPDFSSPFDASDSTIVCPQATQEAVGVLQCLRLNIYVPRTTNKKLPVFVWIHGGGYFFGSAGEYNPKYLVEHDVIAVTVNYRLGPYGFLCSGTADVPGNQGMKDQVSALRWIKENIASFGGDPDKVTVAGESYGGGSVELHIYSEAERLFDKAIVESGAANDVGMFMKPDDKAVFKLAQVLDPDVKESDALKLLVETDPLKVMTAFNKSKTFLSVCKEKKIDGVDNFITADSFLYAPERVKKIPVMIGINNKEAFELINGLPVDYYDFSNVFVKFINYSFEFECGELENVADDAKQLYVGNKTVSNETVLEVIDFVSDFQINYPVERSVDRFLDQGGKVFKYVFSYVGNSPYENYTGVGAPHTEELQYLFKWNNKELTGDANILIRKRMTKMWTNFVKYANPTPAKTKLIPVTWEPVSTKASREYLDINSDMSMGNNVFEQRMQYWRSFWKKHEKKSIFYQ